MEYGMASQVYNHIVQQQRGKKPETDVFASQNTPLRKCTRHWQKGGLCVGKALGMEGVVAHVLAWCSRRHQMYVEQD